MRRCGIVESRTFGFPYYALDFYNAWRFFDKENFVYFHVFFVAQKNDIIRRIGRYDEVCIPQFVYLYVSSDNVTASF